MVVPARQVVADYAAWRAGTTLAREAFSRLNSELQR
jgi:hypothetical protein